MTATVFRDDDIGYERWIAAHPEGWVLNCFRNPTASYLKLHRVECGTVTRGLALGKRLTGDHLKVCSTDQDEIERWALSACGGEPQPCLRCDG